MDVDEKALRLARTVAGRVGRNHRGYVDTDDIVSECYVWLVKRQDKVQQWAQEGAHGRAKLSKALYRHAFNYARQERAKISGTAVSDNSYYTPGVIKELLPDIWDHESWSYGQSGPSDTVRRSTQAPSEGNNRLAMLVDVKWAVAQLSADDQAMLRDRYQDGGVSPDILAATYECSQDTLERRYARILTRIADRLGGEPPWWTGGRRAKSNAQANAEKEAT